MWGGRLDDMVGSELVPPNKLKNREHEWQALQPCTLSLQGQQLAAAQQRHCLCGYSILSPVQSVG